MSGEPPPSPPAPAETPPRTKFNQALDAMLKAFADEAGRPEFYPLEMPRYHKARGHVEELFIANDRMTRYWMAEVEKLQHIARTTRAAYEQAEAELASAKAAPSAPLKELLDAYEGKLTDLISANREAIAAAKADAFAARQSVEQYVASLEKAALFWHDAHDLRMKDIAKLDAELSRLRSLSLTPEEKQHILGTAQSYSHRYDPRCLCVRCEELTAKLRSSSLLESTEK